MSDFLNIITNSKVKGIVALIGAVVMYFTPDHIDAVIETLLAAFGITTLMIDEKHVNEVKVPASKDKHTNEVK